MTFAETLDKHLAAIQNRDLDTLIATLPKDRLVLIMSDGKIVRTVRDFVEAHRAWFAIPTWELQIEPIQISEFADVGVAVLRLDYCDLKPDHSRLHEYSVLTLIFARHENRWAMVHDQNTPIRMPA